MPLLSKQKFVPQKDKMYTTDICQMLIHCQRHKVICLTDIDSKGLWLPFIHIDDNDSWITKIEELVSIIGFEGSVNFECNLINESRLQLTQSSSYIRRITFWVEVPEEVKSFKCCPLKDNYKWVLTSEFTKDRAHVFCGLEIIYWIKFWVLKEEIPEIVNHMSEPLNEYDTRDALKDFPLDRYSPCQTKEQYLIRSACYEEKDILLIYELFADQCYPSLGMTFSSFKRFVEQISLKLDENKLLPTFRAFDSKQKFELTFNELILGLSALNLSTEHREGPGKLRLAYIFRYYDNDYDGFLLQSDVCQMINDIKALNTPYYPKSSDLKVTEVFAKSIVDSYGTDGKLSLKQLKEIVNTSKLRGTSYLFRAEHKTIKPSLKLSKDHHLLPLQRIKSDSYCGNCGNRQYLLSPKLLAMESSGEVFEWYDLKQLYPKIGSHLWVSTKNEESNDFVIKMIYNLYNLRKNLFGPQIKDHSLKGNQNNWFYESKEILIQNLIKLCRKAQHLFEKEDRVLRISTPCYIFGDIHGNFKDLSIFADCLWHSSPFLNESNYLFLGDYVDRGDHGVECMAFLFCLKLLAPKNFWLLRGNHEVRELQESFTFAAECRKRFDANVWNAFNDCFDRLPIAAIIDQQIFCSHGGMPASNLNISTLERCPHVLNDPQNQCSEAWECLWNDPISDDEIVELRTFQKRNLDIQRGFLANTKRGTGYYYSEMAVDRFLDVNDLQMIIRGHECHMEGYKILMKGKVVSTFSTSRYCGQTNRAAVLFLKNSRIRIIRVHTFD